MNKERIEQAIAIMKRAGQVYMAYYHSKPSTGPIGFTTTNLGKTEEELHQCGAAACFAGWVSVSPEFKAAGGWPGIGGDPHIAVHCGVSGELAGAEAIAHWLDIPVILANGLVFNEPQHGHAVTYYGRPLEKVTREDVISKLEIILAGGEA